MPTTDVIGTTGPMTQAPAPQHDNRASDAAARLSSDCGEAAGLIATSRPQLWEMVVELADADREKELAQLVCGRAGAASERFLHDLVAPGETPLMMLCRAAGLDLECFSAILRMRRRRWPFGMGEAGRLLRAYQALQTIHDAIE